MAEKADEDPHSEVVARPTMVTVPSSSPQHISNIVDKERKVRETSVIVGLVSS